jgi:hypothetical protein
MTNNDKPETGAIQTGADGIQRRTIIAGAAWTIPVVATAIGAPLAAASPAPTLTFTNGPYSVAACGTLKDVTIQATTDGTTPAPAGTLVTVTLPSGLTWSDGTTAPRVLPTNANGQVVLSGVKATSGSSSGTISATAGAVSAVGPVTIVPGGTAYNGNIGDGGNYTGGSPAPGIPSGSTAIEGGLFLAPNGDLFTQAGQLIASNVTSAASAQYTATTNRWLVGYVSGGTAYNGNIGGGGNYTGGSPASGIPSGSTAIEGGLFLAPNGDLFTQAGQLIASNVTSAASQYTSSTNRWLVGYVSGGTAYNGNIGNGGNYTGGSPASGIPSGSTAIEGGLFLAPNGDLFTEAGQLIASNVTSAGSQYTATTNRWLVGYVSGPTC